MIKKMVHVGISVVNLKRSIEFYRDALGMTLAVETEFSGELYEKILDLKNVRGLVAVMQGPKAELELFEFHHPKPNPSLATRPVCDHGISHFCIEVEDIRVCYARMNALGVVFHCKPLDFSRGATAAYARDPDGNVFELVEIAEATT